MCRIFRYHPTSFARVQRLQKPYNLIHIRSFIWIGIPALAHDACHTARTTPWDLRSQILTHNEESFSLCWAYEALDNEKAFKYLHVYSTSKWWQDRPVQRQQKNLQRSSDHDMACHSSRFPISICRSCIRHIFYCKAYHQGPAQSYYTKFTCVYHPTK